MYFGCFELLEFNFEFFQFETQTFLMLSKFFSWYLNLHFLSLKISEYDLSNNNDPKNDASEELSNEDKGCNGDKSQDNKQNVNDNTAEILENMLQIENIFV